MKAVLILIAMATIALNAVRVIAEEADDSTTASTEDAGMYLGEIKTICEAEAEGMIEAEAYITECIERMKQDFNN